MSWTDSPAMLSKQGWLVEASGLTQAVAVLGDSHEQPRKLAHQYAREFFSSSVKESDVDSQDIEQAGDDAGPQRGRNALCQPHPC